MDSGDQPDFLEPVDDQGSNYSKRIAKYLFLTGSECGRFVIRPSFDSEVSVAVHGEATKNQIERHGGRWAVPASEKQYYLTLTTACDSLWYTMAENRGGLLGWKTKHVRVKREDREISMELAVAVQRAWARMLQRTSYSASWMGGLDGTKYQFSVYVRGQGTLFGEIWNPYKGRPVEMVELGTALIKLVENPDQPENPVLTRLRAFERHCSPR